MLKPRIDANEELRLRELAALEILDTPHEEDFDAIVELASSITGCPVSLISLVDQDRQWFKAKKGLELTETPRDISFCTHAIEGDGPFVVRDSLEDERFKENPLVTGETNIRFYTGQPLITKTGFKIGTLCAIDSEPRDLTPSQINQLGLLAEQTVRLIELRAQTRELKAAESRLRAVAEEKSRDQHLLQQIFDHMPHMSFQADSQGNITAFNARWYEYAGGTGDFLGWEWKNRPIHHPDDLDRTIERWSRSVKTGEPYEIEYRLRRHDGAYRWHLGRGVALRDASGNVMMWFGTNTDIHDQRIALERLSQAEQRLHNAVTVAKVGFYDWDIENDIVEVSEQFERDWGIEGGSKIAVFLDRMHPEDRDRVREEIGFAVAEHQTFRSQYRVLRADHTYRWIDAQGVVMYDGDGKAYRFFGTSVDITEMKESEQAIREAKDEADRANSAKSTFLANMSHEIRTPLGAIMGFAELAQQTRGLSAETVEYLNIIQRNSVQSLRIVDDILDLAKVESGRLLIEVLTNDLVKFLAEFGSLMEFRARENGIAFRIEAESDLPTLMRFDPTRVRQILTNVVGNAIKFTSRGSVVLRVSFVHGTLKFEVQDTGRGISSDQARILFQPFVQADVSTTRKYGGTGLGLVLTRKLCETMGGVFELKESVLGVGSTFVATLRAEAVGPLIKKSDLSFTKSANLPPTTNEGQPLKGLKILLVEDSPDNQELLKLILVKNGADFSLAVNGREGVEKALSTDVDLVVMDVQMPVMDGHEAVSYLRSRGFTKPVIALSAHAMREEYERAIKSGFTDYLTKPVNRTDLIQKLVQHASQR